MRKNSSTQVAGFPPVARLAMLAIALALTLASSGCALIKVGYRNGDRVGLFMIDRYFDLSDEQEDFVKPRLHQLLVWHRRTQLPDYIAFSQDLQKKAMTQISAADVVALDDGARRRITTMIDHALPDMADLALRLTPDNVKALQKRFAVDDEKWRKENTKGDVDQQKEARADKTIERTEEWYGRFSREQRATIRQLSNARPFNTDIVLGERRRRQQQMVDLLTKVVAEKPPRDVVAQRLKAYADGFEHSADPDKRAFLDDYHHASDEMNAAIHNLATPEQRKHAVQRLQDWIDDFRSLSADAG